MRTKSRTDGRVRPHSLVDVLGISKQAISGHLKRGNIVPDSDGLIHPDVAKKQLAMNIHPREDAKTNIADVSGYGKAKAMHEYFNGRIAELKYLELEGSLLKKDDVKVTVFNIFRGLRDSLFVGCRTLPPKLIAVSDSRKCQDILEEFVTESIERAIKSFNDAP